MAKYFFSFVTLLVLTTFGVGARDASMYFTDAGADAVFTLIDRTGRLDLVDYYNAGMIKNVETFFEDSVTIASATPRQLKLHYTAVSDLELSVLPAGNDTVLMVIETLRTPQADSRIAFYDKQWKALKKSPLKEPQLKDWLKSDTRENRAKVEEAIRFMLVSAEFDPESNVLTLKNNTADYFDKATAPEALTLMRDRVAFVWGGSSMTRLP